MAAIKLSTECELCLEDMIEPRSLPCGHTYCRECLQQLLDNECKIKCPTDRREFSVPDGDAGNLQRNFFLENMLETLRSSRAATAKIVCSAHADKKAEIFCEGCMLSICSKCVSNHPGHKLSDYSASRDKCALVIQHLQTNVGKFKQSVDDEHSARMGAAEAQVAAVKRKVDTAVSKIHHIVQLLNTTAGNLQNTNAQCRQLIATAFKLNDLNCLKQEVTDLSNAATSLTDTGKSCKLESQYEQVEELTRKMASQQSKLSHENLPDLSQCFSDSQLSRGLQKILQYAMALSVCLENDTKDFFSQPQIRAALDKAIHTSRITGSASQTAHATLLQTTSLSPSFQSAAVSNATPDESTNSVPPAAPPPRRAREVLFLAGGKNNASTFAYDVTSDTWRTAAPMSAQREATAAALWNGKMVVAGGWNSTDGNLDTVEQYDAESNSWSALPSMQHKRSRLSLVCLENTLFAIGGYNNDSEQLSSVERYDSNSRQWQLIAPLKSRRCGIACAVLGNGIIAAGGWSGSSTNSCELFDSATQTWRFVTPLKSPRCYASAATLNDKVFVFGGWDGANLMSIEKYDKATNRWTLLPIRLCVPKGRMAAATVNDGIYICGGDSEGSTIVERLDASMRMSRVAPLPRDLWSAAAVCAPVSDNAFRQLFQVSN